MLAPDHASLAIDSDRFEAPLNHGRVHRSNRCSLEPSPGWPASDDSGSRAALSA